MTESDPAAGVAGPAAGGGEAGTLGLAALRERLETALAGRARRVRDAAGRIPAAVLVLFVERAGVAHLVFTQKTDSVPHHAGQFAFPGGLVAPGDASRVDTALREAHEEIGLRPQAVEVLGLLDDSPTSATHFVITPVVAVADPAPVLVPDGREIARVVEIPVPALLAPECFREEIWEREGRAHQVVFFTHGADVVWGATGRIVRELWELLFPGWPGGVPE